MNPYGKFLGDRNPLEALSDSPARIGALVESWRPDVFARSYAQGKWDARQILIHLAHVEMALGYRARQALTISSYQVTPFDQDAWLAKDPSLDGPSAYRAYRGLRELNLALFRNLSAEDRARTFSHPQY